MPVNQTWLKVFALLMGGSLIKMMLVHPLVWVGIDFVVLGAAYQVLKRDPLVNVPQSMKLLGALTAINVLVDLGILEAWMGNFAVLGLVGWMIYRSRSGGGGGSARRQQRHKWNK